MGRNLQEVTHGRRAKAEGPAWVGQVVAVDITDDDTNRTYKNQWLPDKNNVELRRADKPMHFYYMPDRPRLSRNDDGHYLFHLQQFSGVMDPSRKQRIARAQELLSTGARSLCEVALACGFTNQSHLGRCFKCVPGITPKAFLKKPQESTSPPPPFP